MHRKKVKKNVFLGGKNFFFLEKQVFFRAKNKTVIRRGPNPNVCLLVWALYTRDSTFFAQKTKEWTLKKINSINGLVSVFFTSKDPLRLSLICIE